jgi:tetratricopeptide (TPR) repeat protein
MGDFDKAEKMATEALKSDPVDYNSYVVLADVYIYTGKFSEADKYIEEGLRLFPDRYEFPRLQLEKKFRSGDYKDLILDYELLKSAGKKISHPGLSQICIAYQKAGRQKESDDIFQYLKNQTGNYYSAAMVYAARNEKDSAIAQLEAFLELGDYGFSGFKIEPLFNSLKDDARYKSLYTKYGFDKY